MSSGVNFYAMLSGLGETIGGAIQKRREREIFAGLGDATSAGGLDPARLNSAASKAFEYGRADLGTQLLSLSQQQTKLADERTALSGFSKLFQPGASAAGVVAQPSSPQQANPTGPTFVGIEAGQPSRTMRGLGGNQLVAQGAQDAQYLVGKGYSPAAASGIVGHLATESGLNPAVAPGDNGTAFGMAQWRGDRWQKLQAFAQATGRAPTDRTTQLDFLDWELKNGDEGARRAYTGLQAARTPEEAAAAFMHFERPQGYTPQNPTGGMAYGERAGTAGQIYGRLAQGPATAFPATKDPRPFRDQALPQPSQADLPAAGAREAQFVVPGQATPAIGTTDRNRIMQVPLDQLAAVIPHLPAGAQAVAKSIFEARLKDEGTPDIKNYQQAVRQGYQGDFNKWLMEVKRAGATNVSVDASQNKSFGAGTGGAIAKRFEGLIDEGDRAQEELVFVNQLRQLGSQIGTGGRAAAQAWLADKGIKLGDNVGAVEAYSALIDRLTPQQRAPGSGSSSNFDVKMFKAALPRLINTPEGNALITDTMEALAQFKLERAAIAEKAQTGELTPQDAIKELRALRTPNEVFKAGLPAAMKASVGVPVGEVQPKPGDTPKLGDVLDGYRFKGGNPADKSSWVKVTQ